MRFRGTYTGDPPPGLMSRGTFLVQLRVGQEDPDYLEYLLVHEMTHLLERTHRPHFTKRMDKAMQDWRSRRDRLNEAPLGHEQT